MIILALCEKEEEEEEEEEEKNHLFLLLKVSGSQIPFSKKQFYLFIII